MTMTTYHRSQKETFDDDDGGLSSVGEEDFDDDDGGLSWVGEGDFDIDDYESI